MGLNQQERINVLLIGSKTDYADIVQDSLASKPESPLRLEISESLENGYARLLEGGVDVIVVDVSHADKEKLEEFIDKQINGNNGNSVPIILLDGSEESACLSNTLQSGVFDQLSKKKLDPELLARSIHYALERKQTQEALEGLKEQLAHANLRLNRLANIDALTEVLNRQGLETVIGSELNRAQRSGLHLVVSLVNVDDFKRINDALGYAVGDVILQEIAGRLKSTLRSSDHLGRIGGKEFLVLFPDTRFAEGMLAAERLRLAVAESPLRVSGTSVKVTASIGVAVLPDQVSSLEEVLSLVRPALNESKVRGKNRVSASESETREGGQSSLGNIVEILRHGQCFKAVTSPIYRLADEELIGYEMLSRGPEGMFEMPDDFFRISLENNILTIVDLHCFKVCLARALELKEAVRIHVNLFPSTIIATPTDQLLALFPPNIKPGMFCVEIIEQQVIGDPACLRDQVAALKKAGVLVGIDDVGFGASTLETLIVLEPDIVKIDRAYVIGAASDAGKERRLKRLIRVAKTLGSELVAEGITSRQDLAMLRDMDVEFGQGWLWEFPERVGA